MGFRLALAGAPNCGKTGALCALADEGYTLRYVSYDDKDAPLWRYSAEGSRARIHVVKAVDRFRVKGDSLEVDGAQGSLAWSTTMSALNKWPVDGSDPRSWTSKDILVLDSVTELAQSLARRQQVLEGRQGQPYDRRDYDIVQKMIDALVVTTKSRIGGAGMIAIFHLKMIGPDLRIPEFSARDDEGRELAKRVLKEKLRGSEQVPWALAPVTFGSAQSEIIARHFTGALYAKVMKGRGRRLLTVPEDGFNAGVPVEGLARELDIATGLAKVWAGLPAEVSGEGSTVAVEPEGVEDEAPAAEEAPATSARRPASQARPSRFGMRKG